MTRRRPSGDAADALDGFVIEGLDTNRSLLAEILRDPDIAAGRFDTTWLERRLGTTASAAPSDLAGVKVDTSDPLAVLVHGKQGFPAITSEIRPDGLVAVVLAVAGHHRPGRGRAKATRSRPERPSRSWRR